MTCVNRYCVCWTKLGETKEHCFHILADYPTYNVNDNIEPCTNYTVKVSAINTNYHLYSHNVSLSFRTRPMDVTYLKVESKTDTSLNIAWNNTYNNKCTTNYNVTWINLETSQLKYSINSANKLYHNITGLKACTLYQYDVDTLADLGQHSGGTGRVSKTDGKVLVMSSSFNAGLQYIVSNGNLDVVPYIVLNLIRMEQSREGVKHRNIERRNTDEGGQKDKLTREIHLRGKGGNKLPWPTTRVS
uniref:Fibronectin type-III domain-containing protein n=1 Tax=Timema poppense TaxID=170557 RepID=A0A7R9DIH8_TIMPO|nr:unnamed protein product [Timema poppensis]